MYKGTLIKYKLGEYVKVTKVKSSQFNIFRWTSEPSKILEIKIDPVDVIYKLDGLDGFWTQEGIILDEECVEINKRLQREKKLERILGEQTEIHTYQKKAK